MAAGGPLPGLTPCPEPMSEVLASRLVSRTRAHLSEPLFRNAYSLMVNSIMSSGLGLVFWIVAARIYPTETVGRDSAMVAAMVTLLTICQLNLGNAIPRFMPLVADPAKALRKLYAVSTGLALVVATGFVFVVPHLDEELGVLGDPAVALSFIIGTSLWGVFALQDGALTGLRHAPWVPVENTIFGVLKLVSLPLFLTIGVVNGVFLSWLGPMLLLLIPVNVLIFGRVIPAHRRAHPERSAKLEDIDRKQLTRFLAQDFFASALFMGAVAILPLIVLSVVGGTGNAYYYIALTITLALEALVANAGMSLTVESAFAQEKLRGLAKVVLQRALMLMVPCALILVVGAPVILSPFGEDYVQEGTPLLRLFGLTVIFRTFIIIFQYVSRSRGRGRSLLVADLCNFILLIGLTLVLTPEYGLVGAGVAWLIANAIIATPSRPACCGSSSATRTARWRSASGRAPRPRPSPAAPWRCRSWPRRRPPRPSSRSPSAVEAEEPEPEPEPGHERRRRPRLTAGGQLVLLIALAASLASVAVMALEVHSGWSTLAVVLMFSLAPGAALLPLIGARGDGLSIGLVVAASLGITTVIAQVMLWAGWEPVSAAYGVAGLCIPAILVTLRTRGFRPRSLGEAFGDTSGPDTRRSRSMLARALRRPSTQFLILLGAAIFWAAGLDQTDLSQMDGFGLLSALGSGWYVALMLLVVGFALAIWSTPKIPGLYGAYVAGMVRPAARHHRAALRRPPLLVDLQAPGRHRGDHPHRHGRPLPRRLQQLARVLRPRRVAERVGRRAADHLRRLGAGLLHPRDRGRAAVRPARPGHQPAGPLVGGLALRGGRLDRPELLRAPGAGLRAVARASSRSPCGARRSARRGRASTAGSTGAVAPCSAASPPSAAAPCSRHARRRSRPARRWPSARSSTSPSS